MNGPDREKALKEIEGLLLDFLRSTPECACVSARYFMPYSGCEYMQGIQCTCPKEASVVAENIMGFLDVPVMMKGLELRVVQSQSTGAWNIFVYDEEKFHVDNIKNLRVISSTPIYPTN